MASFVVDRPSPQKASQQSTPALSRSASDDDLLNASPDEFGDADETRTLRTTITTTLAADEDQSNTDTLQPLAPVQQSTVSFLTRGADSLEPTVGKDGSVILSASTASHRRMAARTRQSSKRTVTFQPRLSPFDRTNPTASSDVFRGFHTLFWILMAMMTFRTFSKSFRETGYVVGLTFARLFSEDAKVLALSDAVLVSSTILCVPFMQVRPAFITLSLLQNSNVLNIASSFNVDGYATSTLAWLCNIWPKPHSWPLL